MRWNLTYFQYKCFNHKIHNIFHIFDTLKYYVYESLQLVIYLYRAHLLVHTVQARACYASTVGAGNFK